MKAGLAIVLASISAVLFGLSNVCFKLGIDPFGELTPGSVSSARFLAELLTNKWIVLGILLTVASGIFYLGAMSYAEVMKVVAVLSLSYVTTALLANAFLNEALTATRIGGFAFIVLGIVLVHIRA